MTPARDASRGRLRAEVAQAARIVAPLWPLERFVAVNPLQGLTSLGFDEARAEARRWLGAPTLPGVQVARRAVEEGRFDEATLAGALARVAPALTDPADPVLAPHGALDLAVADLLAGVGPEVGGVAPRTELERTDARHGTELAGALDAEVARWCALLVRSGAGAERLWPAWRRLAPHDRRLRRLVGREARARTSALPERADDAIDEALAHLGIPPHRRVHELRGQLARLPGWAGYARWCDEWAVPTDPAPRLSLIDLLAVQLTCDALAVDRLGGPATRGEPDDRPTDVEPSAARVEAALRALGLDPAEAAARRAAASVLAACTDEVVGRAVLLALEAADRDQLLARLGRGEVALAAPPAAQVVVCIDVRSEGLRRQIEAVGPYDTLGFAGFFATAMRFRALGSAEAVDLAPALVVPEVEVREVADPTVAPAEVAERRQRSARASATVDAAGHGPLSMFALAEASGWLLGPGAMASTLAPGVGRHRAASVAGRLDIDADADGGGFSLEERALVAESALRTMGLTDGFAPLVVLCGHGATTTANAHASSLDCGACAGNRGAASARAAAAILNDPAVRDELDGRGIHVPSGTWFLAAEHDTTTDDVQLLEPALVPEDLRPAAERLAADLAAAGRANAAARRPGLPGSSARSTSSPERAARARSADWAQTRPEWGLAGNGSFVVGPRDLTRGLDLDGRAFLHGYDAAADDDGSVLETIMTAPVVVGHWINMAYYGSTVAPRTWGAGDKTLHNPLPGIGVLEGLGGDLRSGLPWQSVADEHGARHLPVRLLVAVVAPIDRVEAVIARNRILVELFDGGWVHLVARPPDADPAAWQQRQPGGAWTAPEVLVPEPEVPT